MVEWLRKSGLGVRMALIAERRLLRLKHLRLSFKLVGAVAARATDQSLAVSGPLEVWVRANVARQALLLYLLRRCLCELKDIARDPAALNMGLTGSVATFACYAFAAVFKGQLGMRIIAETLHLGLMAQGAGLCSDIVCWFHFRLSRRYCCLRLWSASGLRRRGFPPPTQPH